MNVDEFMEPIYQIGFVCVVFLSTNIDNLLCLLGFFSNKNIKTQHVVLGWFAGSALIVFISLALAFIGSSFLSPQLVGLLGIFPIIIGLKNLYSLIKSPQTTHSAVQNYSSKSQIITGATVTLANGGDNISAYAPLFVIARNPYNIFIALIVFIFMTVSYSALGYFLVRKNKLIGTHLNKYGTLALPFVLIVLGTSILIQGFSK
jgi:cadmium resistance protein CadD (predicted permease)